MVQFHNATYNVTEDGGFVEVCVEMKLPFRNASVLISTHSGNALGIWLVYNVKCSCRIIQQILLGYTA